MASSGSKRFDGPGNMFTLLYPEDWRFEILEEKTVTFHRTSDPLGSLRVTAWTLKDEPNALDRFMSSERERMSALQKQEARVVSLRPIDEATLKGFLRVSNCMEDGVPAAMFMWLLGSPGAETVVVGTCIIPRAKGGEARAQQARAVRTHTLI